jgi:predicted O-methyltransferase YrrM
MKQQWSDVELYFNASLIGTDPVLESALEAAHQAGLPPISVSPSQGKLLQVLAQLQGARKILEIGTLGGYSTIWLARALPANGIVVTLELEAHHAKVARTNIEHAGLSDRVEIRIGKALDSLRKLRNERAGPFDLFFIDADKETIPEYFKWALDLSHAGSLIVVDNVVRDGAVVDGDSQDPSVQGVRRLVEMLAGERRVTATAVQQVGIKGYDGFILARVNKRTERGVS